jgi:WD40 repeat protein
MMTADDKPVQASAEDSAMDTQPGRGAIRGAANGETTAADGHTLHAAGNAAQATPGDRVVVSGGSVYGPVVGSNTGSVSATYFFAEQQYDVRGLPNPYLGLRSFTYNDRGRYAGRQRTVEVAVQKLTSVDANRSLLFITGASGSGKSSFAQAGLLPALEAYYQRRGLTARHAVMRPSRFPIAGLADALLQLGLPPQQLEPLHEIEHGAAASQLIPEHTPAQHANPLLADQSGISRLIPEHTPAQQVNLLVIDQFEELFTQSEIGQRDVFFGFLAALPSFTTLRTNFIATMRLDYLPELFQYKTLYDVAKQGIDLRAMSEAELKEAIQWPLRQLLETLDRPIDEKRFEDTLLDRLAHDAASDPAYLPLLQVTLEDLWGRGSLKLGAYEQPDGHGALVRAIRQRAEYAYHYREDAGGQSEPRSAADQEMILQIFLDLVEVSLDDDARRDVRRRRTYEELTRGNADQGQLIEDLINARLLSRTIEKRGDTLVETDVVDIIHETLIGNWDRLQHAISQQRQVLQQRVRFEQALREWLTNNRDSEYLLTRIRLAEAQELSRRDDVALHTPAAKQFFDQSIDKREAERQRELERAQMLAAEQRHRADEQARSAMRLRRFVVALAAVTLLAGIAAFYAQDRARVARERERIGLARLLTVQAMSHLDDQLDLAILLSLEANRVADSVETRGSLVAGLVDSPRLQTYIRHHTGRLNSLAFSPDGTLLASGSDDMTIVLQDAASGQSLGQPLAGHTGWVYGVVFSPDGSLLASASADDTIRLWDVASRQSLGAPLTGHTEPVYAVAFSPDGTLLASGGSDLTIRLWDIATRASRGKPLDLTLAGHTGAVKSLAFSPDGKLLAVGNQDSTISLWDVATGTLSGSPIKAGKEVWAVTFSPDNRTLAFGGLSTSITLWNLETRTPRREPLTGHTNTVSTLAFSPDGTTLASGSYDRTVRLWDVRSGKTFGWPFVQPLKGHRDTVHSVAFSPDGKTLASGSADGSIALWDVADRQPLGPRLQQHTDNVYTVAFNFDGSMIASGSRDKAVRLWDAQTGMPLGAALEGHTAQVNSVAFSPNGQMVASASDDRTIRLWDAASHQILGPPLTGHTGGVLEVAFSHDGKLLASAGKDHLIRLWDVETRQPLGQPLAGHTGLVYSVAFSQDDKLLASGGADQTVRLWDVSSRLQLGQPLAEGIGEVRSVAFNPNSRLLATGGADKTIRVWDMNDRRLLGAPLTGHTSIVRSVAFSPNGTMLASGSEDRTVRLWDLSQQQQLGPALALHNNSVSSLAFRPDGAVLASGSIDKSIILWDVRVWNMDIQMWHARACRIANRSLTREEWQQYLDDEPFRETCPKK